MSPLKHIRVVVFYTILHFFHSHSKLSDPPLEKLTPPITEPQLQKQNFLTLPNRFFSKIFEPPLFWRGGAYHGGLNSRGEILSKNLNKGGRGLINGGLENSQMDHNGG